MRLDLAAAAMFAIALAACSSNPAKTTSPAARAAAPSPTAAFSGGDGLTCDNAVVVHAKSSFKGIPLENEWIRARYPGYEKTEQALVEHDGKMHDVITIEKLGATPIEICFDISEFFGEF